MKTPSTIANMALKEVKEYAVEWLRYDPNGEYLPKLWNKERYEEWTGQRAGSNFVKAIAFEDSDWSAIQWASKLQQLTDPTYETVIFEPYTDWLLTIYDERA